MLEGMVETVGGMLAHPVKSSSVLFAMGVANNFFPPVPIEVATVFAGHLIAKGYGSFWAVALSTGAGMSAGSTAVFFLIRSKGAAILQLPILRRLSDPAARSRTARWLDRYGIAAFFASKLVPGMYFATVAASALAGMSPARAVTGFIISNVVVFSGLVLLGAAAGRHWRAAYQAVGGAGLSAAAAMAVVWLAWRLVRRARQRCINPADRT